MQKNDPENTEQVAFSVAGPPRHDYYRLTTPKVRATSLCDRAVDPRNEHTPLGNMCTGVGAPVRADDALGDDDAQVVPA